MIPYVTPPLRYAHCAGARIDPLEIAGAVLSQIVFTVLELTFPALSVAVITIPLVPSDEQLVENIHLAAPVVLL